MTMKLGLAATDTASLEMDLTPSYDYAFTTEADKIDKRTHGGLFSKNVSDFTQFIIPEAWVGVTQRSIVNSWWSTATNLKFVENHTNANSFYLVRIVGDEEPYQSFRKPSYDTLRVGELVLETY